MRPPSTSPAASPRGAFVRAAFIAFATAVVVASLALFKSRGYGAPDLPGYLLLTALFALVVGWAAAILARAEWLRSWWQVILGWIGGAFLGILGVVAVALVFGAMAGAISLPLSTAWILGGAFGVAFSRRRLAASARADVGLLALVLVVSAFLFEPVFLWSAGSQRLEIVWYEWRPGPEALTVVDRQRDQKAEVEELLRAAGVEGTATWTGEGIYGAGSPAKLYVVLRRPVERRVRLRQPDRETAVYVQEEEGDFSLYPEGVDTRDDLVELEPGDRTDTIHIWVDSSGGRSGRTVVLKSGPADARHELQDSSQ